MKAGAALLLALSCLAPAAAGSSFSASLLDLDWSSLTGVPAVLSYKSGPAADSFDLAADAVRLESDWKRQLVVSEVGHETQPTTTDVHEHGPSSWRANSRGAGATLFLIPSGATVQAGNGSGTAGLPAVDCLEQPWYFEGPRARACPSTQSSVHLSARASAWHITGNFTLVLWGWQGSVTTSQGPSEFWSGSQPTESNLAGLGETELRHAFLRVTGGSLRLNLAADEDVGFYAEALDLTTAAPPSPVQDQAGALRGSFTEGQLHLERRDAGSPGQVTASVAPGKPLWPLGAVGASILVVLLGVLYVRRQTAWAHLVLASKNLDMENPRAAARHATKAARAGDQRIEANVLGAIAAMKAQDFVGATRFLRRLHAVRGHDEAACRFLLAHLRIQQGLPSEGQRLLEECLAIDPTYSRDAAANPVLAPFLDPSKWPRPLA